MLKLISYSWIDFENIVNECIALKETRAILEIGGGANPYLSKDQVEKHGIKYKVVDISCSELKKNTDRYFSKEIADISEHALDEKFDLVFSKMVLEHVYNSEAFHKNVLKMLNSNAKVIHFFATKYGLPSLANLFLPEKMSDYIVYNIQKRNKNNDGKFIAYYNNCLGPTKSSKKWFNGLGYNIESYFGYVGHSYFHYYKGLFFLETIWSKALLKLNAPVFCSNSILILNTHNATIID